MADVADDVADIAAEMPRVDARIGRFVGFDAGRPVVDVGGGRIPVGTFGSPFPEVNEACHVWFINGAPFLMGPTAPKPGVGTVTAVDGDWVTVESAAGVHVLPFWAGYSPAVDDIVKLDWNEVPAAAWVLSTQPEPVAPPPAPGGGGGASIQVFTAVDAGSWDARYGWHLADVWASNVKRGAWFYGTKIADTIPASATPTSIEVYMSPSQVQGAAPNFATHANPGRPGGAPAFTSGVTAVGITAGWVSLPLAFANALKAGGGSFGVGVNQGGFNKFRSLAQDPMSGALRIRY